MRLHLSSPAFQEGERIPQEFTGDGTDHSPPLEWSDAPEGTKSFALVVDDPDAPKKVWVHWLLYNLPPDARKLEDHFPKKPSLPDGTRQGRNDFGEIGYGGPAPPPGKPHRYFFQMYALDSHVDLPPGASKEDLLRSIEGHILDQADLQGVYSR